MKLSRILILTSLILIAPNVVRAQVAGSTFVAAAELRDVSQATVLVLAEEYFIEFC